MKEKALVELGIESDAMITYILSAKEQVKIIRFCQEKYDKAMFKYCIKSQTKKGKESNAFIKCKKDYFFESKYEECIPDCVPGKAYDPKTKKCGWSE